MPILYKTNTEDATIVPVEVEGFGMHEFGFIRAVDTVCALTGDEIFLEFERGDSLVFSYHLSFEDARSHLLRLADDKISQAETAIAAAKKFKARISALKDPANA